MNCIMIFSISEVVVSKSPAVYAGASDPVSTDASDAVLASVTDAVLASVSDAVSDCLALLWSRNTFESFCVRKGVIHVEHNQEFIITYLC